DETHDGRAGTPDGFGYRIVYVAPARIHEAARAIRERPCPLPFVREPVATNQALAAAIEAAFRLDPEPLAIDALVLGLTEPPPRAGGGPPPVPPAAPASGPPGPSPAPSPSRGTRPPALEPTRGPPRSPPPRQFRRAYGTSPYRYSVLRRLDCARTQLHDHEPP